MKKKTYIYIYIYIGVCVCWVAGCVGVWVDGWVLGWVVGWLGGWVVVVAGLCEYMVGRVRLFECVYVFKLKWAHPIVCCFSLCTNLRINYIKEFS